ncbi:hypothetical protein CR513_24953, partial [Mucuna pruriens]
MNAEEIVALWKENDELGSQYRRINGETNIRSKAKRSSGRNLNYENALLWMTSLTPLACRIEEAVPGQVRRTPDLDKHINAYVTQGIPDVLERSSPELVHMLVA